MKSKAAEESLKKRKRRTIEELIADLEAEKSNLLERLKAKELKASPAHKAALGVIKLIDQSSNLAAEEGETNLRHALSGARSGLAEYLEGKGMKLPKARKPRGPRPKD